MDHRLYAFDANGNQLWMFGTLDFVNSSPAVQCGGSGDQIVYAGSLDGYLYAVNAQTGALQWKAMLFGIFSSPAIGPDGTIYVGSQARRVWAIRPDGTTRWAFTTNRPVTSSPAIGSDGTVYVGDQNGQVYAISPAGKLRWAATTGGTIHASPTITDSGRLYIGSSDRNFYAFKIDSQGTAGSCWPMFRHDAGHTGRAAP
jgi:outer membrane protein assembly factor BamB